MICLFNNQLIVHSDFNTSYSALILRSAIAKNFRRMFQRLILPASFGYIHIALNASILWSDSHLHPATASN